LPKSCQKRTTTTIVKEKVVKISWRVTKELEKAVMHIFESDKRIGKNSNATQRARFNAQQN